MPISVRLPPRVEQKLAEYCVSHKVSRSEAVKQALDRLLEAGAEKPSPWELGADIFARHERVKPTRTSRATASGCCANACRAR